MLFPDDPVIELGGKERRLHYDLNSIALIGEKLDIKLCLNNLAEDLMSTPLPFSAIRVILWAGLLHEDPDLTPEQVGAWIDLKKLSEIAKKMGLVNAVVEN